jgi:hypothetical protein
MPSSIVDTDEFLRRLRDVVRDVDELAQRDADTMIVSIARQLRLVEQWTRGSQRPAQADLDTLTFGLMTSRAIEDTDRRLANELYELASYLQYWTERSSSTNATIQRSNSD